MADKKKKKKGIWGWIISSLGIFWIVSSIIAVLWGMLIIIIAVVFLSNAASIFEDAENSATPLPSKEVGTNAIFSKTSDFFYSFFTENSKTNYENYYIMKDGDRYMIVPDKYMNYQLFWYHCNPIEEGSQKYADCSYLNEEMQEVSIRVDNDSGEIIDGIYKYPLLKIFNPIMIGQGPWSPMSDNFDSKRLNSILNQYNVIDVQNMLSELNPKNSITIHNKLIWYLSKEKQIPYLPTWVKMTAWFWKRIEIPGMPWTNWFNDLKAFYGFWNSKNDTNPWSYQDHHSLSYNFVSKSFPWDPTVLETNKDKKDHNAYDYSPPKLGETSIRNNWIANPFYWGGYYLWTFARYWNSWWNNHTWIISKYGSPLFYYDYSKKDLYEKGKALFLDTAEKSLSDSAVKDNFQTFLKEVMLKNPIYKNNPNPDILYKKMGLMDATSLVNWFLPKENEAWSIILEIFWMYSAIFWEETLFWNYYKLDAEKAKALVELFEEFKSFNMESAERIVWDYYEQFFSTWYVPDMDENTRKKLMFYELNKSDFFLLKGKKQKTPNTEWLVKKYVHLLHTTQHVNGANQYYQAFLKKRALDLAEAKIDQKLRDENIHIDKIEALQKNYIRLYNLVVNYNLNVEEASWWWLDKLFWKKDDNSVAIENDVSESNLNPDKKLLNNQQEKDFYWISLSVPNKTFFDIIMPSLKKKYKYITEIFNTINQNLKQSTEGANFISFLSRGAYQIKNDFVNKTMSLMKIDTDYALPFVKYGDFYAQHGNSWYSKGAHWHADVTTFYTDTQVLTNNDLEKLRDDIYWKKWYFFTWAMEKIFNDIFKDYQGGIKDINEVIEKIDKIIEPVKEQLKNGIKTSWDKEKVLKAWKEINELLSDTESASTSFSFNPDKKTEEKISNIWNTEIGAGGVATFPWNWWIVNNIVETKTTISANSILWKINDYVTKIWGIKKEWMDIFKETVFFSYDNMLLSNWKKCNYNELQQGDCALTTYVYWMDWNIFYSWGTEDEVAGYNTEENSLIRMLNNSKLKYRKYNLKSLNFKNLPNKWLLSSSVRRLNFIEKIQAYTLLNKLGWGSFINIDNDLPIFSRTLSNTTRMHWPVWSSVIDQKMVESYIKNTGVRGLYDNLVRNFPQGEWSWNWELVKQWWDVGITASEMSLLTSWKFPDSLFNKWVLSWKRLAFTFRRPIDDIKYEYKTVFAPTDFLYDDIYQHWGFAFITINEKDKYPQVTIPAFNYFYWGYLSSNHNTSTLGYMMSTKSFEAKNGSLKTYDVKGALKNINNVLTKSDGVLWMKEKQELTKLAKSQILVPLYWNIYTLLKLTNLSMLKADLWNYQMYWFYNPNTSITSNLWLFADIIQLNQAGSKIFWIPQQSFEDAVKEWFIDSISNEHIDIPKEKIVKDFTEVMNGINLYKNPNKNDIFLTSITPFLRVSKIATINKETVNKVFESTMKRFGKRTDLFTIEWNENQFYINMKNLWWLPIVTIWSSVSVENGKPKMWTDLTIKKIPFDNSDTCKTYADLSNGGCWLSATEYNEIRNISKDVLKDLTGERTFDKDAKLLDAITKYNYSFISDAWNYEIESILTLLKDNLLFSAWPFYELFYWHPDNISIADYELTSSWTDDFFLPSQLMAEVNSWTKTYIVNGERITNFEQLKEAYLKAKQRIEEYYNPIAKEPIELTPLPFILYMTHLSREETGMTDTRYDNCKNWMGCKAPWGWCLDMNACIAKIESGERVLIDSSYRYSSYANKSFSLIVENWKVSVNRKSTALWAHEAWEKYFNNQSHPKNWNAMNFKNVNIYTLFKTYNMNGIGMYGAWQFSPWQFLFSNGRSYMNTRAVYGINGEQFWKSPDGERYLYLPEQLIQWSSWWGKGWYLKKSFQEDFMNNPNTYLPPAWSSMNCSVDSSIQGYKFCWFINSYNRANGYGVKYLNSIRSFLPEILMNTWGWGGWTAYLNANSHNISALLVEFYNDNLTTIGTTDSKNIQQLFLSWVRKRIDLIYDWKIQSNDIDQEAPEAEY